MKRIAIIGAGAGGLAAAYDLARAGQQVTVFEAENYVGGLAAGLKQPHWDWSVERYYHHWFASDRHILSLIDELGWKDQVIFPRPATLVAIITLSRVLRAASQVPMMLSVRPCVSGLGGIG